MQRILIFQPILRQSCISIRLSVFSSRVENSQTLIRKDVEIYHRMFSRPSFCSIELVSDQKNRDVFSRAGRRTVVNNFYRRDFIVDSRRLVCRYNSPVHSKRVLSRASSLEWRAHNCNSRLQRHVWLQKTTTNERKNCIGHVRGLLKQKPALLKRTITLWAKKSCREKQFCCTDKGNLRTRCYANNLEFLYFIWNVLFDYFWIKVFISICHNICPYITLSEEGYGSVEWSENVILPESAQV